MTLPIETMRQEFEDWARHAAGLDTAKRHSASPLDRPQYERSDTALAWDAWIAARDARHAAAELASAHEAAVELPDEGELEAWRSAATRLRHEARGGDGRLTAAHLLENAYLFAMKLHQQRRGELVSG